MGNATAGMAAALASPVTEPAGGSALLGGGLNGYLAAVHSRWLDAEPDRRWRAIDGTFVFADVSGFTALGERLARHGRIGAEQLTEAVNTVFARLLEDVHALGGDVLKFGGDALLVLFEGDAHRERGTAAALGMQDTMAELRKLRIAGEKVNLRLSEGVTAGTGHLFLCGREHRELIVAGPLASAVCALESAAEPGEVAADADLQPVVAELAGGVKSAPRPGLPPRPTALDPRLGLPRHLHDHVAGDGEHRSVAVGFIQYKGSDALLAQEGPEALAEALDALVSATQEACLANGVSFVSTDVDRDAGKLILVAGAPSASDADDDNLLHALHGVVGRPWPLTVRAGANRGRAFVVDVGPPERHSWTVMGDAVNLAARVMARAPEGGVLATAAILDRTRDAFAREPVEPFMAKGKSEPVHAEIVGPPTGAGRAAAAPVATLVGREHELAVLREALARARLGEAAAVELVGEPGIGKSTLLETLVAEAGENVVRIAGGPYAALSPFRALVAPLRQLILGRTDGEDRELVAALHERVAEIAPDLLPWLPLIGNPLGLELAETDATLSLQPEFRAAQMHETVGRLLEALLPGVGTLLAIEDAHWLDEASAELLHSVMRRLSQGGRMVVLTARDQPGGLRLDLEEDAAIRLDLGPLAAGAAAELLRADVGADLSPAVQQRLVERAGGNPLFLQELVAAALAGGDVDSLPETVEALIAVRIDRLPRPRRAALRQAAVLGLRFPTEVLETLLGADAAHISGLGDFLLAGEPGELRFRHALLREVAYEGLAFARRRALHARAAELIEVRAGAQADEWAELLAIHWHAAAQWARSWHWSVKAGNHAAAHAAPAEAAVFFGRALEAAKHLPGLKDSDRADVAEALGDAAFLVGRFDEAARAFTETRRRRAGDAFAQAALCQKLGRVREGSERYSEALRWYARGLTVLATLPESSEVVTLRARLVGERGAARARQGRLKESLPLLYEAVELAKAADARPVLAHVYYLLDWVLTDLGSPEADAYRRLALPMFEELGDLRGCVGALNNLGCDAFWESRWDEAVECYERAMELNQRVGDVIYRAISEHNIAEIRTDQGRLAEAEALFTDALATWRAASYPVGIGIALSNLGRLATRLGDLDAAAARLRDARGRLESIEAGMLVLEADAREAERRLAARDHAGALELAGEVRDRAQSLGAPPTMLAFLQRLAGVAKLQAGDGEGGRTRLREAIEIAEGVKADYEVACACDTLARLGEDDAAEHAARAAEIFARLGVHEPLRLPLA